MKSLKDINWNHLYSFYEVARAQSLKKGAKIIGVAPSTLSAQIKSLEEKFEKKLFIREAKGLSLSPEGKRLFDKSKVIFEEGSRLLEHYSEDVVGGYAVSIGIEETFCEDLASEFASQYWDLYTNYGGVNTSRQSDHETLLGNLLQGHIDWGISLRKPKRKSIEYAEIGTFEVVFCCSKKLYEKFREPRDILINIPFVENNRDKALNKAVCKHLRSHGIIPKEVIYSDHSPFVQKLCDRGRCVMFLPMNPLVEYEGLETFQLELPLKLSLYALWKKENEGLISIIKLKELILSQLTQLPLRYEDVDLQIEASEVSKDLLK
jgi:DNA-binding transcriptional LysR family regulator